MTKKSFIFLLVILCCNKTLIVCQNIVTCAGNGIYGYSGDGVQATSTKLAYPQGLAVDLAGNLYIAEQSGNRIRKVDPSGIITTVAGTGTFGFSGDGGPATLPLFRVREVAGRVEVEV